jgi:hypothetical protein
MAGGQVCGCAEGLPCRFARVPGYQAEVIALTSDLSRTEDHVVSLHQMRYSGKIYNLWGDLTDPLGVSFDVTSTNMLLDEP